MRKQPPGRLPPRPPPTARSGLGAAPSSAGPWHRLRSRRPEPRPSATRAKHGQPHPLVRWAASSTAPIAGARLPPPPRRASRTDARGAGGGGGGGGHAELQALASGARPRAGLADRVAVERARLAAGPSTRAPPRVSTTGRVAKSPSGAATHRSAWPASPPWAGDAPARPVRRHRHRARLRLRLRRLRPPRPPHVRRVGDLGESADNRERGTLVPTAPSRGLRGSLRVSPDLDAARAACQGTPSASPGRDGAAPAPEGSQARPWPRRSTMVDAPPTTGRRPLFLLPPSGSFGAEPAPSRRALARRGAMGRSPSAVTAPRATSRPAASSTWTGRSIASTSRPIGGWRASSTTRPGAPARRGRPRAQRVPAPALRRRRGAGARLRAEVQALYVSVRPRGIVEKVAAAAGGNGEPSAGGAADRARRRQVILPDVGGRRGATAREGDAVHARCGRGTCAGSRRWRRSRRRGAERSRERPVVDVGSLPMRPAAAEYVVVVDRRAFVRLGA